MSSNAYRSNSKRRRAKRQRIRRKIQVFFSLLLIMGVVVFLGSFFLNSQKETKFERQFSIREDMLDLSYNVLDLRNESMASHLIVTTPELSQKPLLEREYPRYGLFDLSNEALVFGNHVFEQIYPASLTKVMTALVALKYGNLEDTVIFTEDMFNLVEGAQLSNFRAGDKVILKDLIISMLVYSGNDSALAIANHIGGSVEHFVEMMNQEARLIGASKSNFANPHGLHEDNHYTTIYDLYLMFTHAIKYDLFVEAIEQSTFTANFLHEDDSAGILTWNSTNWYFVGNAAYPAKPVVIIGGKTGTTNEAGSCLMLLSQNENGQKYISVITNETTKDELYQDMNTLLEGGIH